MARLESTTLARRIGDLFDGASAAGLTDRQLLERFIRRRDAGGEAAFSALVARHGPMVLAVCRQLLGDRQHAEDAFQAVFLVLARQARTLRDPDLLGNWLYGVSLRTARKLRGRLARHSALEGSDRLNHEAVAGPIARAEQALLEREQAEALHLEIEGLPSRFRAPVVLCYFEGFTLDEAAARLSWPAGTLRSRLARAREKLRRGLLRRGIALSAPALAAALAPRGASASVSPLLCEATSRAAIAFNAGRAAGGLSVSAGMARAVVRAMLAEKLRRVAMALVLLATAATGAGALGRVLAMGDEPPTVPADSRPGRMTVVGRVLDPGGNVVRNATVMVYGNLKQGGMGEHFDAMAPAALGVDASDGSGRFQIETLRTSSSTHEGVAASAIAPGYGVGWATLNLDADQPAAEITLRPEQVVEGRLIDLHGEPAAGVRVAVEGMGSPPKRPEDLEFPDGPVFWGGNHGSGLEGWPRPVTTDAEGRFTLHGIGRNLHVLLLAEDPQFARQRIVVRTDDRPGPRTLTFTLEQARVIKGRVTYGDTGKPVPHAAIIISAHKRGAAYSNRFKTDAEGRFRGNPLSADRYSIAVYAPEGQPYLNFGSGIFPWKKGAVEHEYDIALSRGTLVQGRVTEEGSGAPIGGALLGVVSRPANGGNPVSFNGTTWTGPDGSYRLAVLPKAGTLFVYGPSDDFVLRETGERMVRTGQPGGRRWYGQAIRDCDLSDGGDTRELDMTLRRGQTVTLRVVDPDGNPVPEALAISRSFTYPQLVPWRHWGFGYHGRVRDGRCELHGLDPEDEVPVFLLDPKRSLGATVIVSGKQGGGASVTIRLEPCGNATARLVDPEGTPLAGYHDEPMSTIVATPGPDRMSDDAADKGLLAADQDPLYRVDPDHHAEGIVADAQGRVRLPALIPGATYRLTDRRSNVNAPRLLREFTVRAGETLDLGDLVITHPGE